LVDRWLTKDRESEFGVGGEGLLLKFFDYRETLPHNWIRSLFWVLYIKRFRRSTTD